MYASPNGEYGKDLGERAIRVLEHTISTLVSEGKTVIPIGVLNDILDLLTFTDLDKLPNNKENN